jgi:hypothetical protein
MPALELLHRELGDKGLVVLGIDDDDSNEQSAFLREFGYSFSSLVDPTKTIRNLLNVGPILTTILIDREGHIKAHDVGGAAYETLCGALHDLGVLGEQAQLKETKCHAVAPGVRRKPLADAADPDRRARWLRASARGFFGDR